MRRTFCIEAACCAVFLTSLAAADSITIDGTRYENVYIGSGASMYYIQNPVDGSMISVPKAMVDDSDITITSDRTARRKLREAWKAQRANRTNGLPLTISYREWRDRRKMTLPIPGSADAANETGETVYRRGIRAVKNRDGVVHITNRPRRSSSPTSGMKVFMDKHGVPIMTNVPEEFRGEEYVEVVMHFELIDVPKEFRSAPARLRGPSSASSLDEIIEYYAGRYHVDKGLVYAVIKVESDGNQYAVSSAGARGLMQLMPGTALDMGVKDIFDPAENIAGGTQYLGKLLALYNGNTSMALAGYNAGPGNVRKYGGVPPFKETKDYIKLVQQHQRRYRRSGTPRFDVASSKPVERGYLPKASGKYYQIALINGLTVSAEKFYVENDLFIYTLKGRSMHVPASEVLTVYEPSQS